MLMKVAIFSDCFCALIIPHRNTVAFKTIKFKLINMKCMELNVYSHWEMALEWGSLIGVQCAILSGQSRWTAAWVAKPPVGVQSTERTLVFSWIPTTALKKERKTKHYCSCDFAVRPAHTPHVNVTPCLIQPLAVHLCRSLDDRSADLFSDGANHEESPGSLRTTETCIHRVFNIQFLLFILDACGLSAHFIL